MCRRLSMTIHDINPNFPRTTWHSQWDKFRSEDSFTFASTQLTQDGQEISVEITVNYLELNGQEYHCSSVRI